MTRGIFNTTTLLIYAVIFFALFIPYYVVYPILMLYFAPIAAVLGFFAGSLNTIIIELRRLNGFKFEPYDDVKPKDELIKS